MATNQTLEDKLTLISANVRGLQTNIGDLVHSYVIPHSPDIIATVETFLNPTIPTNFGHIQGYSEWHRRDRAHGTFGGIAVCFREGLAVEPLDVNMDRHLEMTFFRIWTKQRDTILLCVCYRPQWQGSDPIDFLHTNLDALLLQYSCKHLVVMGDMNQHLVARNFEDFLNVYGLTNHVTFPTHISGSSLDPVITDIPDSIITCHPLGMVGSSDHSAILTTINTAADNNEASARVNWLWSRGDWDRLREELDCTAWMDLLHGDINTQVEAFTNLLLQLQDKYIPSQTYKSKPKDMPWFGYHCRRAADNKSRAWQRYKSHPSQANKAIHKEACKHMKRIQKQSIQRWREELRSKFSGQSVSSKEWWSGVKQQQGLSFNSDIPPLTRPDGSVAVSNKDKAELLATHFSSKMTVPDPSHTPPKIPPLTKATLEILTVTEEEVKKLLLQTDPNKAIGPDSISPHLLKRCATQLTSPLTTLFNNILSSSTWPRQWKEARVVAVHKKNGKQDPKNYRPISLLSIIGKILESLITSKITNFLKAHHLLSSKQFGFMEGRSAADLLLLLSTEWNQSLDNGNDTFVVALDIAGAFDKVWHEGLVVKLRSLGVSGPLLLLIKNYLQHRFLRVVVSGHTSNQHPINASVPQGSVLGPLLWNIYFNDILQLVPEAQAYADDCTLAFSCDRHDWQETTHRINQALENIAAWSSRWQVTLAPDKTQAMLISRRQDINTLPPPNIHLEGRQLQLQDSITILGVEVDSRLSFTSHAKKVAKNAAWKLSCIRRISNFLDAKGIEILYKAQVRSLMEYSPLTWSSCPPSYLATLDRVQRRAQRLMESRVPPHMPSYLQPLQQRREVAGLSVMYKVHHLRTPHMTPLTLPAPLPPSQATRSAPYREEQVVVPFSRTEHHQRSFLPHYSRLWNEMVRRTDLHHSNSLQHFKQGVNTWVKTRSR